RRAFARSALGIARYACDASTRARDGARDSRRLRDAAPGAPGTACARTLLCDDVRRAAGMERRSGRGRVALVARAQRVWQAPCADADAVDEQAPGAVRGFFESHFTPYRVRASDGS